MRTNNNIEPQLATLLLFRYSLAPIIYSLAVGIAFVNTFASIGVSMSIAVVEVVAALEILDLYRLLNRILWKCIGLCKKPKSVETTAP